MRITEGKLRSIIRSAIIESAIIESAIIESDDEEVSLETRK